MHDHHGKYPLKVLCRVLHVTESGYHSWRNRPQVRKHDDHTLLRHVVSVHQDSKGRYGAPRVHADLQAQGVRCSRRRVARLMRSAGLQGKGKRKYKQTTDSEHALPVAENLVQRNFDVPQPNTVWAGDLTYLRTKEGWLYLAVLIDLHSRLVVGWGMGSRMTTDLPLSALSMAFHRRRPPPGLVHHSDRGSQYASGAYQRALRGMGMACSMSRRGDCFDNAVVESFFASLKRELVEGRVFASRREAELEVFAYIEQFYNRKRRHSALGYLSPAEFEGRGLAEERRVA